METKAEDSPVPSLGTNIPITMENFDALALAYRPLILASIRKINRFQECEFEDMQQEGLIALYRAIELYRPNEGVYFGVYLRFSLENRMKCFLRNYLPHHYVKNISKSREKGKPVFSRISVQVGSIDADDFGIH